MQDSSLSLQQTLANTRPRYDTPCAVMHTGLGRRAAEQSYATVLDQPYHPRVTVPHTQQQFRWLVVDSSTSTGFYVPGRLMLRWSYSAVVGGLGNLVAAVSSDMIPGPALPSLSHSTSHTTSIQVVCALPPALDFMFVGAWLLCQSSHDNTGDYSANNNNNRSPHLVLLLLDIF